MRVELRDYQQLAFEKAREAVRQGAKRILICAPTGGGKTVIASALMAMTQAKGNRASFVVDRLSLIQQTSDTFDRYQIDHGVIQGGHERWAPHHPIQLCSVQTLGRRGWPETSVDVFDECFPGNTIVHTADGEKRIDSIQVGELVLNAAGAGLVRSVFSKSAKQLLKVRLSNGTVIRCTPDHPIFTDAGWTNAERLAIGSRLYRKEDVCGLWEAAPAEILSEQSDYDMEGGIRKGIQQSHLLQSILREEIEEPNVFGVLCPEDGANPEKYRTCTESKGGEWNAFASDSANGDACSGQRLGVGVRGENQTQSSGRIPTLLQDRRCESDIDDCAGAGRFFALCEITQIARREEGRTAAFVRVESVEVEEHQRGITVYNLRVGGHPSYFADGILVHNCHVLHTTHKKRLMERSTIVVGLTATPFTKGLGKWFDVVINVTTTRALIEQGWLSPYRIFSCAEPDMSGVAVKSTGEWDDKQASGKALEVVGDVVAEYLKHGEGRKFICSGVDTAHVEELQRQFLAAGINAATYTYKDLEEDRAETTNEFRRADSSIRGLITVTAASRGFDVPDVSCVIMARPLRKSLAEHIQLFGRGLRISPETGKKDCIARGTLVLTDCGELPIENITLDHKLWDGVNFVNHGGAVCKGFQTVIEYDGLVATPDHEVFTDDGWTRFEDAARRQRRITRTGIAGQPVRLTDDMRAQRAGQRQRVARAGAVFTLWRKALHALSQLAQAPGHSGLSALQWSSAGTGAEMAVSTLPSADGSVHKPEFPLLRAIRSAWDRIQVRISQRGCSLDCGEPWSSEPCAAIGSQGQRGALRARESTLGDCGGESEQHAGFWWQRALHCLSQGFSRGALCGRHADQSALHDDASGNRGALEAVFLQAQREVWDVLNAGPLQRFTANGRLVHNCIVLDHSGNCARFFDDCESFFDFGADGLDSGDKKEKKKPEKKVVEPIKCPSCRALHKPMPSCPCCGHEYPRRPTVEHVAGTLKELIVGGHRKQLTAAIWPQVCAYVRERREGEAARKQALAIYKEMTGNWPLADFDHTKPVPVSPEVRSRIKAQQIRYAHRRAA